MNRIGLRDRYNAVRDERDKLRAALTDVEWVFDDRDGIVCPWCDGKKISWRSQNGLSASSCARRGGDSVTYRRFLTFYCLLLVALTVTLLVLVYLDRCFLGDACTTSLPSLSVK